MIIQLRGTSGSGKTTAMRRVMAAGWWEPFIQPGRKRPLYYRSTPDSGWPIALVVGGYETPCGGCDGIGSAAKVYDLTVRLLGEFPGAIVLQEGLLLSEDVKWTVQLPDVKALFLTTALDRCAEWVGARRVAAEDGRPVDRDKGADRSGRPKPTAREKLTARAGTIERARRKLLAAGVECRRCSADQVAGIVLGLLGVSTSVRQTFPEPR